MRKGFTLIELLIVVAIIAILAAIAVPNFLEAQVRAKVSRAKADMRTMATALEAYYVDNNKPMTMWIFGTNTLTLNGKSVVNSTLPGTAWGSARYIRVTTPIAYITSVLLDPFAKDGFTYTSTNDISANYDTYDYIDAPDLAPGGITSDANTAGFRGASVSSGAMWRMASAGPDKIQAFGGAAANAGSATTPNYLGVDYDPTNGSISRGDIVRIGSGPGPIGTKLPSIDRVHNRYNETGL